MQLDIFEHSRDTMLRNDVVAALGRREASAARGAWRAFCEEFLLDETVPKLDALVRTVECWTTAPLADHEALRDARLALVNDIEPAALRILGAKDGAAWLAREWQALAQRAARLACRADRGQDHAAPLALRAGDWPAAIRCVAGIESWRRIPAPLCWMTEARYRKDGLNGAWALLAELAWLSPDRLDRLMKRLADPALNRLVRRFATGFDGDGCTDDLAWFPAWVLIEEPGLSRLLGQAQRSQWGPAEQAMHIVLESVQLGEIILRDIQLSRRP